MCYEVMRPSVVCASAPLLCMAREVTEATAGGNVGKERRIEPRKMYASLRITDLS